MGRKKLYKEAVKVAERVEFWQKELTELGIGHWRIKGVSFFNTDYSSRDATVHCETDYDSCVFEFRQDWWFEADQKERDETIIHEWIHVAMRDLDQVRNLVSQWMPEATFTNYEETHKHALEGFVERLSWLLYRLHTSPAERC
jgi:hypothetical protein